MLPEGMPTPRGGWDKVEDPADNYRRSVYIFVRRNTPYPILKAFDFPDTTMSCGRRMPTVTAPQALSLINDRVTLDWAEKFAGRVIESAGLDPNRQIETAYRIAYSRAPNGAEKDTIHTFFEKQSAIIRDRVEKGEPVATPPNAPADADKARLAALVDFCHTLLNSNEFVYKN